MMKRSVDIETNVLVPPVRVFGGAPEKYPWKDMHIGNSFAFPKKLKEATCRALASKAGRRHDMKFSVRTLSDRTFRCWRVDPRKGLDAVDIEEGIEIPPMIVHNKPEEVPGDDDDTHALFSGEFQPEF